VVGETFFVISKGFHAVVKSGILKYNIEINQWQTTIEIDSNLMGFFPSFKAFKSGLNFKGGFLNFRVIEVNIDFFLWLWSGHGHRTAGFGGTALCGTLEIKWVQYYFFSLIIFYKNIGGKS
jgi:hypothetical protein